MRGARPALVAIMLVLGLAAAVSLLQRRHREPPLLTVDGIQIFDSLRHVKSLYPDLKLDDRQSHLCGWSCNGGRTRLMPGANEVLAVSGTALRSDGEVIALLGDEPVEVLKRASRQGLKLRPVEDAGRVTGIGSPQGFALPGSMCAQVLMIECEEGRVSSIVLMEEDRTD